MSCIQNPRTRRSEPRGPSRIGRDAGPVVSATAPTSPVDGMLWYDTSDAGAPSLKIYSASLASWNTAGGATALNDLTDVTIASPSMGQYLRKSAGDWLNAALAIFDDPTPKLAADLNLNAFGLDDSNGNALAKFVETASANQYIELTNADSTFGQGPKIAAAGTGTDIDLRLSAKGAGQVAFQDDAQFNDNIKAVFGSGDDATISWDGTKLIIDSGTGDIDTNGNDIKANLLGLGGSPTDPNSIINAAITSATINQGMNFAMIYTGSLNTGQPGNFLFTFKGTHASPDIKGSVFTANLNTDPATGTTVSGIKVSAGMKNSLTASITRKFYALRGAIGSAGFFSVTAGTTIKASVYGEAVPVWAGAHTEHNFAGLFDDDLQVTTDNKLVLSGSTTAKGDDYLTSDGTDIRAFTGGTRRWATNADGFDIEPDPHVAAAANGIRYGGATTALGSSGLARTGNIPTGGSVNQAGWINVKVGASSAWIPYWT